MEARVDPVGESAAFDSVDLAPEDLEELAAADPNPEPVAYSGSDFDVEGLVRRLDRGDIVIPTFGRNDDLETSGFQRRFVWNRPQMDRFIESLLLGYPIPGIFLVQQADKRYLVLDGQQRLKTLEAFYDGIHGGRTFVLANVGEPFVGLTYKTLPEDLRRALDSTFIHATIVRTDGSSASLDSVYQIFERLNAGGTQLTAHEIRVALYAGPFIEYLTSLNENPDWRDLYGAVSPRLRDQELVLRVIALYVAPGAYKRPLKKFLNDFVAQYRALDQLPHALVAERFSTAVALLNDDDGPGPDAFRSGSRQVNAALTEALLVGLFRRLDSTSVPSPEGVSRAVREMLGNAELQPAISRATADEDAVRTRLAVATNAFAQT